MHYSLSDGEYLLVESGIHKKLVFCRVDRDRFSNIEDAKAKALVFLTQYFIRRFYKENPELHELGGQVSINTDVTMKTTKGGRALEITVGDTDENFDW